MTETSSQKVVTLKPQKKKPVKNWQFLTDFVDTLLGSTEKIRLNMFTQAVEISKKLEWDDEQFNPETSDIYSNESVVYHRAWGEKDTGYLRRILDQKYPLLNFSDTMVAKAVDFVAATNLYNPLKEHIENLPVWDGEERLENWLFDICNASWPSKELIKLVGKKFILGMVKRAYFPGTKMDSMLILEGRQGIGKSTLARLLAGGDRFFSDDIVSDLTDSRQILEKYAGKLVVEIGELGSFTKAEQELLKRFIVAQDDSGRPAYGRYNITVPRSFVFVGSTNQTRYMRDETGTRRYWPVRVSDIDTLKFSGYYRDQLLAEAKEAMDYEKHYFYGDEIALEKEYEELKRAKLNCGNEKLLFWLVNQWDTLLSVADKDSKQRNVVSGVWLYEFVINNFEGNFSTKQYGLVLQALGCSSVRRTNGIVWFIPDTPEPYEA